MDDIWFYRNYHANRPMIKKFWDERPKGFKLCPNCQRVFSDAGFPVEGSWTCSEICSSLHNIRHSNEIKRDSISRLYLLDFDKMTGGDKNV